MTKPKSIDFVRFALSHVKPETVPKGAVFPVSASAIGTEPWEYLYGTTGALVTQALLDERYKNFYAKKGWSRDAYDLATRGWIARGAFVCDCEGLLDSFLRKDVTANYCYAAWCTEKGAIQDYELYPIGAAVFVCNSEGRMTHVGFVCGYARNEAGELEPLIVEERGIRFGCVITRFSERPWTHRGLPTAVLDFTPIDTEKEDNMKPETPVVFKLTNPMMQNDDVRDLQKVLNYWGYTDDRDNELAEDGKLGKCTMQALTAFVQAHMDLAHVDEPPQVESHTITIGTNPMTIVVDGEELVL